MIDTTTIIDRIQGSDKDKKMDEYNQDVIRSFLTDVYVRFCGATAPIVVEPQSYGIVWGGNVHYRKGYATMRAAYYGV